MRKILAAVVALAAITLVSFLRGGARPSATIGPQFTADGKLTRPEGYRRGRFVFSGFWSGYRPQAGGPQGVTNVFVSAGVFRYFLVQTTLARTTSLVTVS